ncbi:Cof-type HAD-IIB family hydrolase [Spiroplasma endosymbiont of Phyllotreta cruciferae]|uniref:Cof-type HAD-IIB family hydrolase n=1 Tax=Spiroplasma endosymbiont of Phyllotreta cruciferae TaxID=2886375 RepID=UPI0020A04CDC|nr:Cof-type HAD-IIB family hydrolase [Spiroplasma endosymbiont of Phyllotreta cruciferae]
MKLQHLDKKRLILIDLDGTTLMNDGKTIHPKTQEVIKKAVNVGHKVCIITGRPHRASIRFYRELGLDTLLTNFDGGHIHDPLKREFKRLVFSIAYDVIISIINHPGVKDNVENVLIEHYDKAICWKKDEAIENYFHLDDVADDEYFIADPYNSWKGPASNMALYLRGTNKTDEVLRMFENFKNSVLINIGHYSSKQNQTMINITNKLVSKGFAADILAQYYNVDIRDVIAFGDEINDLELLQNVGYGVAMKNSNDNLKTNARGITHLTNNEGGVGDYLEKLLNGENV